MYMYITCSRSVFNVPALIDPFSMVFRGTCSLVFSVELVDIAEICVRSDYCLCKAIVLMYPTLKVNFCWLSKQVLSSSILTMQ